MKLKVREPFSGAAFLWYCLTLLNRLFMHFHFLCHVTYTQAPIISAILHLSYCNYPAEDSGGMRLKRKRMPSEKLLDFEAENVKKPLSKLKASSNLLKNVR